MHQRLTAVVVIIGFLAVASVASAQNAAQIAAGQKVFTAQKCAVCHSVGDQGNKKGPLDGIGSKLSAEQIHDWIVKAPEMAAKVKAERKPPMKGYPNLPQDELDALVAYVQSLKK